MNNTNETKTFSYTYSAKQQEEIRHIRSKYVSEEGNKMEQLRKLDQSVNRKATILSLAIGILGSLIMGIGMCCTMVWENKLFVPGIIIGITGIAIIAMAYPAHNLIIKKERQKIAPEIIRLTDELLK